MIPNVRQNQHAKAERNGAVARLTDLLALLCDILLAATGGGLGTTCTFCFETVPFPPIETADEFFNAESQLRHVKSTFS